MDLQAIAGLKGSITLITLVRALLNHLLIGRQICLNHMRKRHLSVFLGQKSLSPFGIPLEGGRACPLLSHHRCFSSSGIQGEGEVIANREGELDILALVDERLAEVHALLGQGGAIITHCSHFCLLLN